MEDVCVFYLSNSSFSFYYFPPLYLYWIVVGSIACTSFDMKPKKPLTSSPPADGLLWPISAAFLLLLQASITSVYCRMKLAFPAFPSPLAAALLHTASPYMSKGLSFETSASSFPST